MIISRKELIKKSAYFFQDKPAFVCEDKSLSFIQVNDRANRLANALKELGLKPKDRVATLMRNCLQYPEIEFGLVKGCFPQITLNPRLTAAEQLFQINETKTKAIIVQNYYIDLIKAIYQDLRSVKIFICFDGKEPEMLEYEELLSSAGSEEPEGELNPDDIGEIRYTSGTTGIPKGVVLSYFSRLSITRNFLMEHLGDFTSDDKFLALQPLYHGAGWFILPVWIRGGTHFITPRYDPKIALDLIEKKNITTIKTVPTVLLRLINYPEIKKRKLRTIRNIIYGGSPMPVERLKEAIDIFGLVFTNLYGQLEAPMTITWMRKEENSGRRLGSIGRPCAFVKVKIVDSTGNEVQPSEIGQVVVRGDHQMIGYLNRPDITAETIQEGWIHTGDLGTKDKEGYIYLTGGRKSEMIISGGLNIYPGEVEQVLYKHPSIAEVGVIGVPDPEWGDVVKACVVLKEEYEVKEQELIEFSKEHLAGYKRPKSIDFFKQLPHTAAGKIMYSELRKLYQKNSKRLQNTF